MSNSNNSKISENQHIVVVQNCGNVGLAAIKTLLAKGGCKVRTASRNPDKLKTTKLKDLDVEVYKTGDDALFEGIDRFVCIAPGPKDPDMRAKVAIDFVQKAKDSGAKHGAVMSVVVAAAENRRGIFGAQFGAIEDTIGAMSCTKNDSTPHVSL